MAESGTNIGALVLTLKGDGTEYFNWLNEMQSETKGAAGTISAGLTAAFAATAAAFAVVAATAVKEYADAEEALVNSTANMRGATNDLRNDMMATSIALSNASDSVASVEELNKAFGDLRNNGKDAAQAMQDIAVADKFAIAANIEAGEAANLLAKAQNAVGMSSKNAAQDAANMKQVSDVITIASREGATSMQGMAEAIASVGPMARTMGMGLNQVASMIAGFTKQGMDAGEAGQSLNQMLRTLSQSTTTHAKDWAYYGMSAYDASGKLKNMADIFDMLKGRMAGLNEEEQRQMLADLGFQARFVKSIQLGIQMSGGLRDLQAALEDTGDATSKVADTQMTSLNAQMAHAYNEIKNVFIVIGSYLTPVIEALLPVLQDWLGDMNNINSNTQLVAQGFKVGFVLAIQLAMDTWTAFMVIIKGGELIFAEIYTAALAMATMIVGAFDIVYSDVLFVLNGIITAYNNTIGKIKDSLKLPPIGKEFQNSLDAATQKLGDMTVASQQAANAIAVDMVKSFQDGAKASDAFGDKALALGAGFQSDVKQSTKAASEFAAAVGGKGLAGSPSISDAMIASNQGMVEARELLKDLGAGYEVDTAKIDNYVKALTSGKVTMDQFNAALDKMNPSSKKEEDPFTQKTLELQQGLLQENAIYKAAHAALLADKKTTTAELEALDRDHNEKVRAYTTATTQLQVGAAASIADSVLSITGNMFSQKSGIYKAMFAVDKAFAIAEATIDMGQAIAKAGTLPYPANLGAMATVASDMATIISDISSVAASFDGGGMTPSGPRTGGLDGRGGFMAILHPNEKITDMTRPQPPQGQGGGETNVNIHNYAASAGYSATAQPGADGGLDVIIQKATDGIANGVIQGGSPISKALEQTYRLKRGT